MLWCIIVSSNSFSEFYGYAYLASGLSVGLSGLASGMAIGIAGDAGVRANGQRMSRVYCFLIKTQCILLYVFLFFCLFLCFIWIEPRLYVGMILILIFGEAIGLYGLIVGIVLSQAS